MNLYEIFLGQVPEAVYFALFLIFTKSLKEKRILFTILMIIDYLLLKSFIHFDVWFQVSYTIMTYVILKVLYKGKAQITDIFTFGIASFALVVLSIASYFIFLGNDIIAIVINRLLTIGIPILLRNKLSKINNLYKKFWNRHNNDGKVMKSTTFRAINTIVFNLMFVIINACMIYALVL